MKHVEHEASIPHAQPNYTRRVLYMLSQTTRGEYCTCSAKLHEASILHAQPNYTRRVFYMLSQITRGEYCTCSAKLHEASIVHAQPNYTRRVFYMLSQITSFHNKSTYSMYRNQLQGLRTINNFFASDNEKRKIEKYTFI